MSDSIGMAIKITENNREKISVVNGNVVPEDSVGSYFFFPYNPDERCDIIPPLMFHATYRFANTENEEYFVDIDEI